MADRRDAEAELNLPPGFRFHPTDDELVVYYLSRKAAHQCLPVPIIAEVDLYKFDPWDLPEKALFGQREWYFFTPRDRKYPNGSRPNRAAGRGYWKATGADKPVSPPGYARPLGIKKALVFYHGKAPKGIKTDWIMHEYRLADTNHAANTKGSLRLDEWVLCRLYNKKNAWEKMMYQQRTTLSEVTDSIAETASESLLTPESDIDQDGLFLDHDDQALKGEAAARTRDVSVSFQMAKPKDEDDWFMGLNLDDLQSTFMAFGSATPGLELPSQDYYFPSFELPSMKSSYSGMPPY